MGARGRAEAWLGWAFIFHPVRPWKTTEGPSAGHRRDFTAFFARYQHLSISSETMLGQFFNINRDNFVLLSDMEDEVVKWMPSQWLIKTIGPTIPSKYLDKRLEDDTEYDLTLLKPKVYTSLKWLNSKETCSVTMSYGSLAEMGIEAMEELAWGLRNSDTNFLWVVRESEQGNLPSTFIEETSDKGLVVTWCPQLDVLAHQAVGFFVTLCGWNSTLEALSLGVPMVAMLQWADQPTNAK